MIKDWSEAEIVKMYREAKNKAAQVMILADLTCSDEDTILKILEKNNLINPKPTFCRCCGRAFYTTSSRQKQCVECQERKHKILRLERDIKVLNAEINERVRKQGRKRAEIDEMKAAMPYEKWERGGSDA